MYLEVGVPYWVQHTYCTVHDLIGVSCAGTYMIMVQVHTLRERKKKRASYAPFFLSFFLSSHSPASLAAVTPVRTEKEDRIKARDALRGTKTRAPLHYILVKSFGIRNM